VFSMAFPVSDGNKCGNTEYTCRLSLVCSPALFRPEN